MKNTQPQSIPVLLLSSRHKALDPRIYYKWYTKLNDQKKISLHYCFRDATYVEENQNTYNFYNLNYFSYLKEILNIIKRKKIKWAILHDWDILPLFFVLRFSGVKFILDVHEDYHFQYFSRIRIKPFSVIYGLTFWLFTPPIYILSSLITCPSVKILKRYPQNKSFFISNGMDFLSYRTIAPNKCLDDYFVYVGGISKDRGIDNLVNLAKILKEYKYTLKIAGPIRDRYTAAAIKKNENIQYIGTIDFEDSLQLISKSSGGVIPFNNVGQLYIATALKLYEYSAFGKGILIPNFGEWTNLDYKNVFQVDYKNHPSLRKQIEKILETGEFPTPDFPNDDMNKLIEKIV